MANRTITLKTQAINHFGPSPATKWSGTFKWTVSGVGPGNGSWGYKSAACQSSQPIIFAFFKNALTHSSMSLGITFPSNAVTRVFTIIHAHTLNVAYANSDKVLSDGSGFSYIYPLPTTNIENRLIPSFACQAGVGSTYSSASAASTIWS